MRRTYVFDGSPPNFKGFRLRKSMLNKLLTSKTLKSNPSLMISFLKEVKEIIVREFSSYEGVPLTPLGQFEAGCSKSSSGLYELEEVSKAQLCFEGAGVYFKSTSGGLYKIRYGVPISFGMKGSLIIKDSNIGTLLGECIGNKDILDFSICYSTKKLVQEYLDEFPFLNYYSSLHQWDIER